MRLFALSVAGTLFFTPIAHATEYTGIFNASGDWPADVQLHDFNNDGNLDLLAFDFEIPGGFGNGNPSVMRQYTGNGDGTFTELSSINLQLQGRGHTLVDLNADGYVDLMHDRIYPGTADGTFSVAESVNTLDLPACPSKLIRDFNSDGLNDLMCQGRVDTTFDFEFFAYINQGAFAFERGLMLPTSNTENAVSFGITQGDLNNDGVDDIVTVSRLLGTENFANSPTRGHLFSTNLNTGNWFADPIDWIATDLHDDDNPFATNAVSEIKLADFNNDGNLDLIVLIDGFRATPDASLVVYTGDGTGRFSTEKINTRIGNTLSATGDFTVVDIDEDGNLDVVLSFSRTGNANPELNVAVFNGQGDGSFAAAQEIAPELRNVADIAIGDVDGDGQLDVAVASGWSFGTFSVLSRAETPIGEVPDGVCLYAGSDTDGDGWGFESGMSCRVTAQSMPGTGGRATNGFTFQNVSNNPPCILEDSDPDGDGWGWEDGMSCIFGADTITTFNVEHPACESAASDADGDGWGWENNATCVVE